MAGMAKATQAPVTSARPITTGVVARPAPWRAASSCGHRGGDDLGDDDQATTVVPVGGRSRPRCQHEDADELGEVDDPDQEGRAGEAVDEDCLGDVLEPGAAVGEQVPGEVRPEVPVPEGPHRLDDPQLATGSPRIDQPVSGKPAASATRAEAELETAWR